MFPWIHAQLATSHHWSANWFVFIHLKCFHPFEMFSTLFNVLSLTMHVGGKLLTQPIIVNTKDDATHIYVDNSKHILFNPYINVTILISSSETLFLQVPVYTGIRSTRSFFETIESLLQPANIVLLVSMHKSFRLFYVGLFFQFSIKEH